MRIKRQEYDFIQRFSLVQHVHRFYCEWVPVSHRHYRNRINVRQESFDQPQALPFRQRPNWRPATDLAIFSGDRDAPPRRNKFRNRTT